MSSSTFVIRLLFSDSAHPHVMLKIILDPVMPWKTASLTRTAKLQPAFIHSSCLSLVLVSTCQVDLDVQALYSLASVQGQKNKKCISTQNLFCQDLAPSFNGRDHPPHSPGKSDENPWDPARFFQESNPSNP